MTVDSADSMTFREDPDMKPNGRYYTVHEITDRTMTISHNGSPPVTIAEGETARVGLKTIRLDSADGRKAEFHMK